MAAPTREKPSREALLAEQAQLREKKEVLQGEIDQISARLVEINKQLLQMELGIPQPLPTEQPAPEAAKEKPLTDEAIAESILRQVGFIGSTDESAPFKSGSLSQEELEFLKKRFHVLQIEAVPVKALETKQFRPFFPPYYLRVKLEDGTVCALTQAAFRRVIISGMPESDSLRELWHAPFQGAPKNVKEYSGFFRFENFRLPEAHGYEQHIKDAFGAVVHAHAAPMGGYEAVARFNWYFEHDEAYSRVEKVSGIVVGQDDSGGKYKHYVAWVQRYALIDEDPREIGPSAIEIGVSEADFRRIMEAIGDGKDLAKLKNIREVMGGIFPPEFMALLGFASWKDPTELVLL